jgi:hypothetical protein
MSGVMVHVSTLQEDEGPGRLVVYLERPPLPGRGTRNLGGTATDFTLTGPPQAIKQAGETLYARLTQHPEFSTALVQAMAIASGGRCPLFIHLDADGDADRIPWEILCAPGGTFLGLEPRWSVARVVDSTVPLPGTVAFQPPLRIAALLSCLEISAADEWAALIEAVDGSPVPVEILALVGEPDLEQQIADEGRPGVRVLGIPGPEDDEELRNQVVTFRPHILHFFCHGSIRDGAHLELATQADWISRATVSSLFLEPNQVAALGDPVERPWLAMLNCCQGAAAEGEIHSLASDLVYTGGFPAVIGMREPIASDDASQFSARFYPALFDSVGRIAEGVSGVLDWSGLVVAPRRGLVQRRGGVFSTAAAERHEWTLPVLYLRPEEFQVGNAPPPNPADILQLEVFRSMRRSATASSPPSYVAELDRLIGELERRVGGS